MLIKHAKISKILVMSNNPTYPKIKAKNKKQYLVKTPPSTIAVGIFLAIPDFLNKS